MAIVYAPNKKYTGLSAGVSFAAGKGETDNPHLLAWFRSKGYAIEELEKPVKKKISTEELAALNAMDEGALKAYAAEKEIDLGNASTQAGYIKKIVEALKAGAE